MRFTLPGDVPGGTVPETDEQNNCSFNTLHGQAVIIMPLIPTEKSPE